MDMIWILLWAAFLLGAGAIVRARMKDMEDASARVGLGINAYDATRLHTLSCSVPLEPPEISVRLADGMPAGELVCAWDAERRAFCFRSELPDGSAPLYFTVEFSPLTEGTRLTLIRQKTLLHGRRDGVMLLPGYLAAKLGATGFAWTKDEERLDGGIR